jgi:hypothetical protein
MQVSRLLARSLTRLHEGMLADANAAVRAGPAGLLHQTTEAGHPDPSS